MFSVNNFYSVFNSYYGWPQKNNNLWIFTPHGSKNWLDLDRYGAQAPGYSQGAIIMHDQEPFFVELLDKFKDDFANLPNSHNHSSWASHRQETALLPYFNDIDPADSLSYYIRSSEVPIFCHSEKNSKDIAYLESKMYIPCYYWWHGMVARDWFRHWERHRQLEVYNKATANFRFLFYCRATDGTRQYRETIKTKLSNYSVLGSKESAAPELSAVIDITDATQSAVHIVAETLFDTDKIYLTEKVFKPMVMSQPFILFSAPGALQYLRDYGFKTFSSCWDESYDTENNAEIRKDKILGLIQHLQSMSQTEFSALYERALPIIRYNRNYFFSNNFQDLLWNELRANMDAALTKQQNLKESWPGGTDFYHYHEILLRSVPLNSNQISFMSNAIEFGVIKKDWVLRRYPAFHDLL